MKQLNKKGQVMQNLGALGVGVAAITIILAITFLMMSQVRTNTIDMGEGCANRTDVYNSTIRLCCNGTLDIASHCGTANQTPLSTTMNSTQDLTNATATIPGWVSLIILVAIGGVILALVSRFRQ